jgi:hypothetical protein
MDECEKVIKEMRRTQRAENQRAWRARNKDKVKELNKNWNASQHGKEYRREYYKNKKNTDNQTHDQPQRNPAGPL